MLVIRNIYPSTIEKRIVNEALRYLKQGDIVIYPSDTCYGIAVDTQNQQALDQLSLLKQRKPDALYSVNIPNIDWIQNNCNVDQEQEHILRTNLPGPFTFRLNKQPSADLLVGDATIGVRLPRQLLVQFLVSKYNKPITATSANISGEPEPYSLDDLQKGILRRAHFITKDILVLNGGQLKSGAISTLVDITQKPYRILRQGIGKFEK